MYQFFLDNYPDHPNAQQVTESYARTLIINLEGSGSINLPKPERSGWTSPGTSELVIQNDLPYQIRLVFYGPETRVEKVEECESCDVFFLYNPQYCPSKGPIGRFKFNPWRLRYCCCSGK